MRRITRGRCLRPAPGPAPRHPASFRSGLPRAEALEGRLLLATFAVTNVNDTGAGSFRQAIRDANAGGNRADTIVFDPGFFSVPREILVHNYPEQFGGVSGPLTVIGPGSGLLTIRPGNIANPVNNRALDSFAPVLTLSGMTVTGGNATGNGGGLFCAGNSNVTLDDMAFVNNVANNGGAIALSNNATLTIRNSRLTGNRAGIGGGIYFFDGGSLVMETCTLSGNTATRANQYDASGGAIYFFGAARPGPLPPGFTDRTLLIRDSTLSGNSAFGGGGGVAIDWFNGTFLVRNSTISGNTAGSSGGGIYNVTVNQTATITLENATVTGNSAGQTAPQPNAKGGGGIARVGTFPGAIHVTNSVVSGNTNVATPDILSHPQSPVTIRYSAVGSAAGFTPAAASGNNLPYGANLLLGPLSNNGGRTLTHMPQPGSPLVDSGSTALVPAGLVFDQRGPGFPRVLGPAVDIGSVERPHAPQPPQVRRVFVANAGTWAAPFRTHLGDTTFGYAIPSGADQLDPLPWPGLNRISVRFSQDVVARAANLAVTGENVASYAVSGYSYDPATFTGTWNLAQPLVNDRVTLRLDGDAPLGVAAAAGGIMLDGNGDGAAGGDFVFGINVLRGDVDQSGRVTALDLSDVKRRLNRSLDNPGAGNGAYLALSDATGDGRINALDLSVVRSNLNQALPAPGAPPPATTALVTASLCSEPPHARRNTTSTASDVLHEH